MPLTMMQKRADFASLMESLLQAHDAEFTVDTTEREELELGLDRKSRLKVTAANVADADNPVDKYCYIRDIGQEAINGDNSLDAAGNVDCYIGHRFDVQIFYVKDYDDDSQTTFETIIYADRAAATPGVLDSIRSDRHRIVSGEVYNIGLPQSDAFENIVRGNWDFGALGGQPELVHYLNFQVLLI